MIIPYVVTGERERLNLDLFKFKIRQFFVKHDIHYD